MSKYNYCNDQLLYTQEDINEWIRTCEELQEKIKEQEETIEELSEYKKLEEQGLLVRLPCKVGNKVYYIYQDFFSDYFIEEETVLCYEYNNDDMGWQLRLDNIGYIPVSLIGDIIFLTFAEAEKKLKELEGEEK